MSILDSNQIILMFLRREKLAKIAIIIIFWGVFWILIGVNLLSHTNRTDKPIKCSGNKPALYSKDYEVIDFLSNFF
jgi:hypothetical protein